MYCNVGYYSFYGGLCQVFICAYCVSCFALPCPQGTGEEVPGEELHEILKEIDTNMNGQVELDEYLQVTIYLVCFTNIYWET